VIRESSITRIFFTGRPPVSEAIRRYFWAVVIPISPSHDDITNYLERRLDTDDAPEAVDEDLRADIVKIILEKMSNMCVGAVRISPLPTMCTYSRLCIHIPPCFP